MADEDSHEGSSTSNADQNTIEVSSTSNASGKGLDSTVELNVKTLDSQIYSFQVEENMPVSLLKEKIANQTAIPVGQQRLIFRGKVLKDDDLLSEYHVENGHTFHLVERLPAQSQPNAGSGEASRSNSDRGIDAPPRNRVGQISHNVVVGTFNVGNQGEGFVPDLNRVIGAVFNTIGVGGPATSGLQSPASSNAPGRGNQRMPQVVQIPLAAASAHISFPSVQSLQTPVPASLDTLSEFMNRMEHALAQNGYRPNSLSADSGDLPRVELPSNAQGVPTTEALSIVLRRAQRLLSTRAIETLSHIAGRLEQEATFSDSTTREQIQTEAMQIGLAMQHFGALLLELGRTIMTLRMGQSPEESVVNAGHSVYISPTGPNPMMVQPLPLQTSSFTGGPVPPSNPVTLSPVGTGNPPRNINIHIHAGTSLASMVSTVGSRVAGGDGTHGGRDDATGSGRSGTIQVLPVRNVITAAAPSRPVGLAISSAARPGGSLGQSGGQADFTVRNSAAGSRSAVAGEQQRRMALHGIQQPTASSSKDTSRSALRSSEKQDTPGGARSVPLGLGLGGLEKKKSIKLPGVAKGETSSASLDRSQSARVAGSALLDRSQSARIGGRQVLQTLASRSASMNMRDRNSVHRRGGSDSPVDMASAMSQVLQSPALDGLLAGVSDQAGVGSPNELRSMLHQLTQDPAMMNTVSQIAQQVDSRELDGMFAGYGRAQGGGMDLSRMMQQMMPVVSRALSGGRNHPQFSSPQGGIHLQPERTMSRDGVPSIRNINLQRVAQRIEQLNPPEDIFRSVFENAVQLYGNEGVPGRFIDELCSDEDLVSAYMEMLFLDLSQRLQRAPGQGTI